MQIKHNHQIQNFYKIGGYVSSTNTDGPYIAPSVSDLVPDLGTVCACFGRVYLRNSDIADDGLICTIKYYGFSNVLHSVKKTIVDSTDVKVADDVRYIDEFYLTGNTINTGSIYLYIP